MTQQTPARYLFINYLKLKPESLGAAVELLQQPRPGDASAPRSLYRSETGDRVIEFIGLPTLAAIEPLLGDSAWRETELALKPLMTADFRRQVHVLRDVVKDPRSVVPSAANLQLRRIEVPQPVLDEYEAWRQKSIFAHVRASAQVDTFLAYHSVISTEPGVIFLSTYSCKLEEYQASFQTPDYQGFVKYAGEHYITGGPASLHTSLWTRL